MKTIKLNQLLKQISELPWVDAHATTKFATDECYARHAANVLPELIKASNEFIFAINNFDAQDMAKIEMAREHFVSALSRATEVKFEE